MPSLKYLKLLY